VTVVGSNGGRTVRELNTEVTRTIEAPADEVWSYRLDFLNLPEYNADVRGVECTDQGGSDHVGATYRFDLVTGDRSTPVELRVTEAVPGELVAIDMDGAIRASERFTVIPDPRGCHVAISLTMFIPDQFPPSGDADLLANGEAQIGAELDSMGQRVGAPVGGSDRG
jgi:uncharacterized protein YndB with AHSA1/START domain